MHIINGRAIAAERLEKLKEDIRNFVETRKRAPALAVIIVGNDPASEIYVRYKVQACEKMGVRSVSLTLPEDTSKTELLEQIQRLNDDATIDGILLQLPLPKGLNAHEIIERISPLKDVDGLHPLNQGYLFAGTPRLVPCTPQGCMEVIQSIYPDLSGKQAVVVGRSVLVGRPMAALLTNANATVTLAHSHTKDLKEIVKEADIVVAAIGKPKFITVDMIKPGALVIDVGINRTENGLVGDVDFEGVCVIAGGITPVPGGVGPLTIAHLLVNTVKAGCQP
jgi:methylenetetrahydrofolate dehydrogenase (NADP+)/methenyltetrahydrofolate cyclohydrolase